jgi:rhodanese-related sulfurtransferase
MVDLLRCENNSCILNYFQAASDCSCNHRKLNLLKGNTMNRTISREALAASLRSPTPPVIVEALPEKYYREQHLPGALHMPHDQVDALASGLIPSKSTPVVVYCASATCQNSHIAARRLTQLGYENVRVYPGGKQDWEAAGLPFDATVAA